MANLNIETFYKSFPTLSHRRNRFPFEKEINFNMKMGEITPICAIRVVPGQTLNLDLSTVIKVAPLQNPPMDSAVWKACAFYNPDRNTWTNYKYWFGEKQKPENPEEEPTYLVPKVTAPENTGFTVNSFYDNIGCSINVPNYKIDAFLPRTDRQIYNTYFRNQALENPLEVNLGDEDDDPAQNMTLRKVCRPRDYFAQALPTQTGTTPVEIPLGSSAPVVGNGTAIGLEMQNGDTYYRGGMMSELNTADITTAQSGYGQNINNFQTAGGDGWGENRLVGLTRESGKSGLIAELSQAAGAPLEGLYQAIAYNTLQYITSRGGNRYFEQLSNIYGCVNPDGVLQQPEFLGSTTQMISFDTVTQTSSTENQETPLAHRAANGYMEDYSSVINKSFGEFGWIIIYAFVTHYPKYQQGVNKLMQTNDPLELFNPIFNLMGDEPIYRSEIYVQSDSVVNENGTPVNDEVWGYGKRNSKLLYPINEVHGEQRSTYSQSLDTYHFGEYYSEMPTLNKDWDKISDESFKRNLQITDETQFLCNCVITGTQDLEVPLDPIPSPIPNVLLENRI